MTIGTRHVLFACLSSSLALTLGLTASAAGQASPLNPFQIAQGQSDEEDQKPKKQGNERGQQRQDAKPSEQRRERAEQRQRGPDRADQQHRQELREERKQQKALQQQRQRDKALRDEQHRRRTIDADRERKQQLREERDRQRTLREERNRQRTLQEQQPADSTQRQQQDQRQQEALERQRKEQRQRVRRERQENIIKQTDEETVRTRKRLDLRGREQYATSRHHRVRDRRYRNRYRNGFSIFFLPPIGVSISRDRYYLYGSQATYDDYVDLFLAPPVVDVTRRYTMDEIVEDPEVRAMVRSVDIDMITFATGSAIIRDDQLYRLDDLANAMLEVLQKDPYEKFLIEGYTDAVGNNDSNLLLSEERAAAVQSALIERYGIPADNLEAVGYGEQYLLVETQGPERRNRRVTIRAVGDLLAKTD